MEIDCITIYHDKDIEHNTLTLEFATLYMDGSNVIFHVRDHMNFFSRILRVRSAVYFGEEHAFLCLYPQGKHYTYIQV